MKHKRVLMTEDMEMYAKEISSCKRKSKDFLIRAGLLTKDGRPTKPFR